MGVLLLVGAQQLLASFGKKRLSKPKQLIEMGTQNKGDVDFDWIPKDTLTAMSEYRTMNSTLELLHQPSGLISHYSVVQYTSSHRVVLQELIEALQKYIFSDCFL